MLVTTPISNSQAVSPLLRQPVRGGFQHHVGQPGIHHAAQVALQVGGIRRGHVEAGIQHLVADHRVDRGDHARLQPGLQQDAVDERGGGRLAVRAGHADHGQRAAPASPPARRSDRPSRRGYSLL